MSVKTIVIVTTQPIIVMIPITSFTTTLTRNSIITSGDNYRNVTIGNQVNTNNNKTISIQNHILEDSFIETTIAPIETYTMTSSTISITGWFAALTKLWSDLIDDIE